MLIVNGGSVIRVWRASHTGTERFALRQRGHRRPIGALLAKFYLFISRYSDHRLEASKYSPLARPDDSLQYASF